MISMKDGALRLALPTAEYTKMVHDVEQEVAFEEAICGQLPFSQRHSRIDTLLEFAVWKHICKLTVRRGLPQANMPQGITTQRSRRTMHRCLQEAGNITINPWNLRQLPNASH